MPRFISKQAKTFNKNEKGVTMLEYGLIAALIAVVAVAALTTVGSQINAAFTTIGNDITTANTK